ncbi:DcaP family trimeric outer membrane transporter [Aureibacter tunicatorum]|uniref:Porin n=1 Tax=Aureibacter tunicatorum TaxID=866807 RepID=A0AAE3XN90_9BACT|nr:DcaP family trimeric outer membrane transporter [Aureibacter tunicatorum]MDR6239587.1 hypothetical protein [Aureibacter tunicatorum]BDD04064.1 hypothetical protein AUTU_15470 [Aureibacter tunicatorum]
MKHSTFLLALLALAISFQGYANGGGGNKPSPKVKGFTVYTTPTTESESQPKFRVDVGGLIQLNSLYDITGGVPDDEIYIQNIAPTGTDTWRNKRFHMDGRQNRIKVESFYDTGDGEIITTVEGDFHGSGGHIFRLRLGWVEYKGFRFGFDWTTMSDGNAWPNVFDFNGPSSVLWQRKAIARYTHVFGKKFTVQIAAEQPDFSIDYTNVVGTETPVDNRTIGRINQSVPDIVGAVGYKYNNGSILRLAGIIRSFRYATLNTDETVNARKTTIGAGASLTGKFYLYSKSNIIFQANYGRGLGDYYVTTWGFPGWDALPSLTGENVAVPPSYGIMGAYQHFWARKWSSTFTYSYLFIDKPKYDGYDRFDGDAILKGHYTSGNVSYHATDAFQIALEYVYANRHDINDVFGQANRVYFAAQYWF